MNNQAGNFIVKYDSYGNVVWINDLNLIVPYGICTDINSNIYLTGECGNKIFIAKYDSSGDQIWMNLWGFGYTEAGESINVDALGNVYVSGGYFGTLIFGNDTLAQGGNVGTAFIVKLNSSGNVIWAKSSKGYSEDGAVSISTDVFGSSYITGSFRDTIVFGIDTLTNGGTYSNMFIVKYDSSGDVMWARSPGDTGFCWGNGISLDANGNPYVTGQYINTITFGFDTLTSNYGEYPYIAKYDKLGNPLWAINAGGGGDILGQAVSIDGKGNVYVSGAMGGTGVFGNDTINTNFYTNLFVAKIGFPQTDTVVFSKPTNFNLYPNPSNGNFIFSGVQTGSSIEVYDMLGEVVYSGQTNTDIYPVSLSGHAKGMYFYTVRSISGAVQQGKMILE